MKDADKMTPEELRALAEQKENECDFKPYKKGTLKHDLYWCDNSVLIERGQIISKQEIDFLTKGFEVCLEKGTEFYCYIDRGSDYWYDDAGFGMEGPGDYIEKHLENIEQIEK